MITELCQLPPHLQLFLSISPSLFLCQLPPPLQLSPQLFLSLFSSFFFFFLPPPTPKSLVNSLSLSLSLYNSASLHPGLHVLAGNLFFFFFSSFPECKWLPTYPAEREGLICSFVGMRSFQMTCQLSLIVGCLKKAESFGREKLKFSLIFG